MREHRTEQRQSQKPKKNGAGEPAGRDRDVQSYMEILARALSAGDAKTIATLWDVPALVMSDQGVHAVSTRDEVEAFFSGAKEQYAARGIYEARADIQSTDWVTERLVIVRVRWPYVGPTGQEMGEESSTYTLRRDDSGALKMCAIVMHGAKGSS